MKTLLVSLLFLVSTGAYAQNYAKKISEIQHMPCPSGDIQIKVKEDTASLDSTGLHFRANIFRDGETSGESVPYDVLYSIFAGKNKSLVVSNELIKATSGIYQFDIPREALNIPSEGRSARFTIYIEDQCGLHYASMDAIGVLPLLR